jgi:hypothetical protein
MYKHKVPINIYSFWMSKSSSLSIYIKDTHEFITEIIAEYDIKKEIAESNNLKIKPSDTDKFSRYPEKKIQPKYFTWCNCHQIQSYVNINPQQCFNLHHDIPQKYMHNPHDLVNDIKNRTVARANNR